MTPLRGRDRAVIPFVWFAISFLFLWAEDRSMAMLTGVVGIVWTLIIILGDDRP